MIFVSDIFSFPYGGLNATSGLGLGWGRSRLRRGVQFHGPAGRAPVGNHGDAVIPVPYPAFQAEHHLCFGNAAQPLRLIAKVARFILNVTDFHFCFTHETIHGLGRHLFPPGSCAQTLSHQDTVPVGGSNRLLNGFEEGGEDFVQASQQSWNVIMQAALLSTLGGGINVGIPDGLKEKRMNRIIGAVIGLSVAVLAQGAFACEAVSRDSHLKAATAAFTGTITTRKLVENDAGELLEFTVDKAFRGNISEQVTVIAPPHPCRYREHAAGETWLIVGTLTDDGKVKITWDSPSVKITNADGTSTKADIEPVLTKLK